MTAKKYRKKPVVKDELKECPFCGCEVETAPSMRGLEAVYHPNNGCLVGGTQFRELWNHRADSKREEVTGDEREEGHRTLRQDAPGLGK